MQRSLHLALPSLLLLAAACGADETCPPGTTQVADMCRTNCISSSDCASGDQCDPRIGVCLPGSGPMDATVSTDATTAPDTGAHDDAAVATDSGVHDDATVSTDSGVHDDATVGTDSGVHDDATVGTDSGVHDDATASTDSGVHDDATTGEDSGVFADATAGSDAAQDDATANGDASASTDAATADTGIHADATVASDAGVAADAVVSADAQVNADATIAGDTGGVVTSDTGIHPDATVASDTGIHADATVASDTGIHPDAEPDDTGVLPSDSGVNPDADPVDTGVVTDAGVGDTGVGGPDAGTAVATASPTSIDFGRTVIGLTETAAIILRNPTSQSVTIRFGAMSGAAAGEYSPRLGGVTPPATRTLGPSQATTLEIAFAPAVAGTRAASYAIDLCDGACPQAITLAGVAVAEAIDCTPALLNLGFVNPGSCADMAVTCENTSDYDSTVVSWTFTSGATSEYVLSSNDNPPAILAPGEDITLDVEYCPTDLGRDDATIAVTVLHPNPALSTKTVAVTGEGGGPDISCAPDNVDLGVTAVQQSSTRRFSCTNAGNVTLLLSSIDFGAGSGASLSRVISVGGNAVVAPFTLAAGESVDVDVTFTPTSAGLVLGTIETVSNDRDTPLVVTGLSGQAIAATPNCAISGSPASLDFGGVAPGGVGRGWAMVENTGTDPCAVSTIGTTGGVFSVASPAPSAVLQPTESLAIEVFFAPAIEASYTGSLNLQTSDPNQPTVTLPLEGTGLADGLLLLPNRVDFGNVAVGCDNILTKRVFVANLGAAAVTLSSLSIEAGSSPAFSVTSSTGPITLAGGSSTEVRVGFAPGLQGPHVGRLMVQSAGLPAYYVQLAGNSTADGENTLDFAGSPGRVVDLLLVVDDSCSMTAAQTAFTAAAGLFVDRGNASGADYHIAVTTADPTPIAPNVAGGIRGGVITSGTPDARGTLITNVTVGIAGGGVEHPLFAAAHAVTDPTLLGGVNSGFLRATGELEIVILTDEEDQSPNPVESYLGLIQSRQIGFGAARINTITGGTAGCTSPAGANPNIIGAVSPRLVAASSLTGGSDYSICSDDYASMLEPLADRVFAGRGRVYRLFTAPSPGSVEVRVDGVLLASTSGATTVWTIDQSNAAVIFEVGQEPAPTSDVSITYRSFCVSPTCGNLTVETGEQCDDGDSDDGDTCPTTCFDSFCGDTFLRTNVEQCDDGNLTVGDGCDATCIIEGCGNGRLEAPEECDDGPGGNSDTLADACRLDCTDPSCGDSVTDTGEGCDDGNFVNTDSCLVGCIAPACGDDYLWAGTEQCDDGNVTAGDGCDGSCRFETTLVYTMPGATATVTETLTNRQFTTVQLDVTAASYLRAESFTTVGVACTGSTEFRLLESDGVTLIGSDSFDGINSCSKIDPTVDAWARLEPGAYYLTVENQSSVTTTYSIVVEGIEADLCGNGVAEPGANEECDDGDNDDTDFCTNACLLNIGDYTIASATNQPFVVSPGSPITFSSPDDGTLSIAVGFPFEFAGAAVTTVTLGTNGLVAFESDNVRSYTNVAIPTSATPNAFVAWWWDDLIASAVSTTTVSGVTPNRIRRFSLLDFDHYGGSAELISVEVRLYETTNVIEVHYGNIVPGTASWSGTVGWESHDALRGADALGCGGLCSSADWPSETVLTYTPVP